VTVRGTFIAVNSSLFSHPELVDQLAGLACIPKDVAKAYRQLAADRKKIPATLNAAHRQSPLIVLTAKGRRTVQRIHAIERAWRPPLAVTIPKARLRDATAVLR
jgi:hypothetical protein